jgi:cytolysin-activating lysine-acyltransferase
MILPSLPEDTDHAPAAGGAGDIFKHAPPEGHAKTVSAVLGEIVWLMSQSPLHKTMLIADLEWMIMTPMLLQQFRLYYDSGDGKHAPKPIGVVLWAFVSDEVAGRLSEGTSKLRPQDWKSGGELWVVEAIAPFGGPEEIVQNLKSQVFPDREMRYLALSAEGQKEVKVL